MKVMPGLLYKAEGHFEKVFYTPSDDTVNDFKQFLLEYLADIKRFDSLLPEINTLGKDEVYSLYKDFKLSTSWFDELHEKYYDEKYLGDEELKILLNDIDKQLNKLEAVAHKYYSKYLAVESTPDYIKTGLIQYSQDALGNKLAQ